VDIKRPADVVFAYTTDAGETPRWRLSTGIIELATPAAVRIKACRLGYLDSAIVTRHFQ